MEYKIAGEAVFIFYQVRIYQVYTFHYLHYQHLRPTSPAHSLVSYLRSGVREAGTPPPSPLRGASLLFLSRGGLSSFCPRRLAIVRTSYTRFVGAFGKPIFTRGERSTLGGSRKREIGLLRSSYYEVKPLPGYGIAVLQQ